MGYIIDDVKEWKACKHPEHNPPSHISVPRDKVYVHECPLCGNCSWILGDTDTL